MKRIHDDGERRWFWCPGCQENHGPSHSWRFNGDFERPTFEPSILVRRPDPDRPGINLSVCHSFVRDGRIMFLADSTHAFAGKTVELPPWED